MTLHTYLYEEDMVQEISDREGLWQFDMPDSNVEISILLEKDWRDNPIEIKFNETNNNHGELYSNRYYPYYGDEITLKAIPCLLYTSRCV